MGPVPQVGVGPIKGHIDAGNIYSSIVSMFRVAELERTLTLTYHSYWNNGITKETEMAMLVKKICFNIFPSVLFPVFEAWTCALNTCICGENTCTYARDTTNFKCTHTLSQYAVNVGYMYNVADSLYRKKSTEGDLNHKDMH